MISQSEIARSLTAVWGIFLGRRDAVRQLDASSDGFWRSFQAIVLVAPLYAASSLSEWHLMQAPDPVTGLAPVVDGGAFFAAKVATLCLDWITFPIVLALLGGILGIRQTYATYVVARNWSVPVVIAPFALIALLDLLGLLPGDIIVIPSLIAFGYSLRFSYMVVRATLGVGMVEAVAYVVLDFLVSLALVRIIAHASGVDIW